MDLRTLVPNLRTCTKRMFGRKNTEHTNVRGSLFTVLRLKCQEGARLSWPLPLSCPVFSSLFSFVSLLSPVYFILYNLVYIIFLFIFIVYFIFYFLFLFMFLVMLFVCSILLHGFFAVYIWVFFFSFLFLFFIFYCLFLFFYFYLCFWSCSLLALSFFMVSLQSMYGFFHFFFVCIFQYWVCVYGLCPLRLCAYCQYSGHSSLFSKKKKEVKCSRIQDYGIFTCTKISATTVVSPHTYPVKETINLVFSQIVFSVFSM